MENAKNARITVVASANNSRDLSILNEVFTKHNINVLNCPVLSTKSCASYTDGILEFATGRLVFELSTTKNILNELMGVAAGCTSVSLTTA